MQNPASRLLRNIVLAAAGLIITQSVFAQDPLPSPTPLQTPPPIESPPPLPSPSALIEVNPCIATVTLSSGEAAEVRSTWSNVFPVVSVGAGDTLNIELGFPLTAAGATLLAASLDGGNVLADSLPIGLDGLVSFQFQVGTLPGLYRLLLNVGGQIMTLQFSVPNPDEPAPTPTP